MDKAKRPRLSEQESSGNDVRDSAARSSLTRACAECKKHKIKCDVRPGQSACNKCLRSGISCVPYNFAQKFIDGDTVWKAATSDRIEQIEASIRQLLSPHGLPSISGSRDPQVSPQIISPPAVSINHVPSPGRIQSVLSITSVPESELIPAPMSNLYNLSGSREVPPDISSNSITPDFIDKGIVNIEEAEFLYSYYRECVNTLLWAGILCPYQSLQQARQSSPILASAVLTVAAFHAPGRKQALDAAYNEFVRLVEQNSLVQGRCLDDIRGLCIGAFYLTNLSWRLCSQTVRIAAEINLHHVSLSISRGYTDLKTHENVRLWYVLYICDHQFATAYGRPTLMHDDAAIRKTEVFLTSLHATPGDIRLAGQVKIQQILNEAYTHFGHDANLELVESDYEKLQAINIALDQWRLDWVPKSIDMPMYRSYPSKSKILYYHFTRFHLNSLSLRGLSAEELSTLRWYRRETINAAIFAAQNTLKLVVEEEDIQKALVGVPIFTHSMIAMCASFLIRVAIMFGGKPTESEAVVEVAASLSIHGLHFHVADALDLVNSLVNVLVGVTQKVSQRHLAHDVVNGLTQLLQQFTSLDSGGYLYNRKINSVRMPGDAGRHEVDSQQRYEFQSSQSYTALGSGENTYNFPQDAPFIIGNFNWNFDENAMWHYEESNF